MQFQSHWVLGWLLLNIVACSLSIPTPRCNTHTHTHPNSWLIIFRISIMEMFSSHSLESSWLFHKHVAVFLIDFSFNVEPFWKIKQSASMQQIPLDLSAKQHNSSCQHKPFCAWPHPYFFVERHLSGGLSFCLFSKKTRGANKFEAMNPCFETMKINPKKVVLGPWVTDPYNRS